MEPPEEPLKTYGGELPKNPLAVLNFRDWVYIPHILGRGERALLAFFAALALIGGAAAGTLFLYSLTHDAPALGGVFREGEIKTPEHVNPIFLSSNDTDRDLTELVFSKLFSYGANGEFIPDLAENYTIADGGKSYLVTLRNDVRWHDGVGLDADDVVFTIKAIQDPAYKSSMRPNWQGVTVERLGDYVVGFRLKQPYSPFLQNLAIPIIPRHVWEKIPAEAAPLAEANLKPIGSGPYRFKEIKRDANGAIVQYALEANTDYYREGPHIRTIEFSFYDTGENLLYAYQKGEIDGISIVAASTTDLLKSIDASVWAMKMPRIFGVFLNESNPILKDKTIRQALALAIPKEELIKKVLGGGAVPIDSPIPPGVFGYNPNIPKTPYDPERARQILEKAGWKTGSDGIRAKAAAKRGGEPTQLKITLTTSDWRDLASTAEALRDYWKAIGVAADLKILPIADLETSVIRPRKYDALLFGEILGRDPDPFAFWHSSQLKDPGLNIALYHSPKVDALLEEARRLTDRDQIKEKYQSFQQILSDDFPTIFLYSPIYYYALRANVHNVTLDSVTLPSERFASTRLWYIKTKRVF